MEQSDATLLARWVERRDAEAMAEIVARHSRMVYATCRRILGSGADAADATQECFIRLAAVRRAGPSLAGLLHTTATRTALNQLRAETRRRERERRYVETLDPAQQADWDDVQGYVDEAIAGLDEKLRDPLVRHFLEGETHESIARGLGLSRAGVSYRIDRGIREVRKRLRRRGIAVAAPALAGMLASGSAEALPAELAQSLGRAAIAGIQPATTGVQARPAPNGFGRILTGKGALPMKIAAVIAGILAITGIFIASQHEKAGKMAPPAQVAAAAAEEPSVIQQPDAPPPQPAPAVEDKPGEETPATIDVTVVSDTGYIRPDVCFSKEWPRNIYVGDQADSNGQIQLPLQGDESDSYMAFSHNTNRAALFRLEPGMTELRVVLNCGLTELTGRVVDETGGPVPIAAVELLLVDSEGQQFLSSPTLTDVQGYYRFDTLPGNDGYTVQARVKVTEGEPALDWGPAVTLRRKSYHMEMADLRVPEDISKKVANNPLFLTVGGCYRDNLTEAGPMERYSGVVVDPEGRPIPDVFVDLSYSVESWGISSRAAVTGADGRWSRMMPAKLPNLTANFKHENYASTYSDRSFVRPSMEAMRNGSAKAILVPGIQVRGVVQDEGGEPVPDALVYHSLHSFTPGGPEVTANSPVEDMTSTRTAADGSFKLTSLPAGHQELKVRKIGFASKTVPIEAVAEMAPLKIVLDRGGTIRGRVINEDGEPVPGAHFNSYTFDVKISGQTDENGEFLLDNVPLNTKIRLGYDAKGYYGATAPEVVAREEPYELVLHRPLVFKGNVVDGSTGRPVTEFEVAQFWNSEGKEQLRAVSTSSAKRIASADGAFSREFRGVGVKFPSEAVFAVQITAAGYYPGFSPLARLGEKMEPFTVRLERGEALAGIVLRPDGQPAVDAEVLCTSADNRFYVTHGQIDKRYALDLTRYGKTGADGGFSLPGSREPLGLLALHETGYAIFDTGEYVSGGPVSLTPWATVSGTVYHGGAPDPEAQIGFSIVGDMKDDAVIWTDIRAEADGKFLLTHVPAVPLEVGRSVYSGKRMISHGVQIQPAPGEHVVVEIGGTGATVTGQVEFTVPEGLPADFDLWYFLLRILAVSRADPPTTYKAEVEKTGEFRIEDVPPGAYALNIELHNPPMDPGDEWPLAGAGSTAFELTDAGIDLGVIPLDPAN